MDPGTDSVRDLSVSSRSERGYIIAALSGEPGIACAPALREQLLGLLRPAASRLVIDLSRVSYADASRLAVLVGTGRRAGLPGGVSLAAPTAAVDTVLRITGLRWQLDIFPTVHPSPTPQQSPRPSAVFAASSTRPPTRPQLKQTRARTTAWSGSSPSASGT